MARAASASVPLLDRLGVGASALCLVHCLALPFVLTALSAGTGVVSEVWVHAAMLAVAFPLAAFAAWPGYREHRDRRVLGLLAAGAVLLVLAFAAHEAFEGQALGARLHTGLTVAGSAALMLGHVRNFRLRAACTAHVLPHHAGHHHGAHGHDAHA